MMTKRLEGKIALVTGGSRGIGAAIVKKLAQEGAQVAFSYASPSSKEKAENIVKSVEKEEGKAFAFKADQADANQVEGLVKAVVKQFGRIDILVNNAGVGQPGAIDDPKVDIDALKRQYTINVEGVVVATRAAVASMKEGGRIILIGSVMAQYLFPGFADYGATKAALTAYAKGWARDLGPKNITVNVVQPGPIDTDMNPKDGTLEKIITPRTALGRYGKPEEVAAAVAFLASPEASYITGTALTVDGGFCA